MELGATPDIEVPYYQFYDINALESAITEEPLSFLNIQGFEARDFKCALLDVEAEENNESFVKNVAKVFLAKESSFDPTSSFSSQKPDYFLLVMIKSPHIA